MTLQLPDVSLSERSPVAAPLQWVGMKDIEVPIWLDDPGITHALLAQVDLMVNLPQPWTKGIHMSRLYRLLDSCTEQRLGVQAISQLLLDMTESHRDCGSSAARVVVSTHVLRRAPALVSEGLSGWRSYPIKIEGLRTHGRQTLTVTVDIDYASTCPCSAALSRQLLASDFRMAHLGQHGLAIDQVVQWLETHGSLATPHSQRSVARIRVALPSQVAPLALLDLIAMAEAALKTPVQAAVKRADEQAFARLNGENLMYVEDAARRLKQALDRCYLDSRVQVTHYESLHPHQAYAEAVQHDLGSLPAAPAQP